MNTRTIQTSMVEYTVYNRVTEQLETFTTYLEGTFANEESIKKALSIQLLDSEIILKAKVTNVATNTYGMTLEKDYIKNDVEETLEIIRTNKGAKREEAKLFMNSLYGRKEHKGRIKMLYRDNIEEILKKVQYNNIITSTSIEDKCYMILTLMDKLIVASFQKDIRNAINTLVKSIHTQSLLDNTIEKEITKWI